jgi:hypothetical protein
MRVEGCTRTRNLKKSIKVMIIIIVLFLLSWLPIHIYRLATTFYPLVKGFWANVQTSPSLANPFASSGNRSSSSSSSLIEQNLTSLVNSTLGDSLRGVDLCSGIGGGPSSQAYKDCLFSDMRSGGDGNSSGSSGVAVSTGDYKINTLHNRYVFFVCYFMAMSSVCYNPIVYFWMHKKFRTEVQTLFVNIVSFRCRWCCSGGGNGGGVSNSVGARRGVFTSTLSSTSAASTSQNRSATGSSRKQSILTVSQGSGKKSSTTSLLRSSGRGCSSSECSSSRKTSTQTNQTRPSLVSTQSAASQSGVSALTNTGCGMPVGRGGGYSSCYMKNEQQQQQSSSSKIFGLRKFGKLSYMANMKARTSRFNSLSSASTASSGKRQEHL